MVSPACCSLGWAVPGVGGPWGGRSMGPCFLLVILHVQLWQVMGNNEKETQGTGQDGGGGGSSLVKGITRRLATCLHHPNQWENRI